MHQISLKSTNSEGNLPITENNPDSSEAHHLFLEN